MQRTSLPILNFQQKNPPSPSTLKSQNQSPNPPQSPSRNTKGSRKCESSRNTKFSDRARPKQLVRRWYTENYLNILFIRPRPSGRYISRGVQAVRK